MATTYHDQHIREWRDAADHLAGETMRYINEIFRVVLPDIVYERYGRIRAINQAARTVAVDLEQIGRDAPVRQPAQYGEPAPVATDIGKRARFWLQTYLEYGDEGPPVRTTALFLDCILGGQ